jgi:hypothetical protein
VKKLISLILAAALTLCLLAGCAAKPAPSLELPPVSERRAYALEDTFALSCDGEGFVLSGTGLGLSREQVAAAYGYGFGPGDAFWKTREAPPSGEIRFGMTYAEVEDLVSGNTAESSYARHIGTDCCNSLCGGLCDVGFIFNAGSGALDVITIRFPEGGDDAATWFELYSRFTELFGAPDEAAQTGGFTTPDELRTLLSETDAVPTVAWSRGAERLVLKPDLFARGRRQVSVTISRP